MQSINSTTFLTIVALLPHACTEYTTAHHSTPQTKLGQTTLAHSLDISAVARKLELEKRVITITTA